MNKKKKIFLLLYFFFLKFNIHKNFDRYIYVESTHIEHGTARKKRIQKTHFGIYKRGREIPPAQPLEKFLCKNFVYIFLFRLLFALEKCSRNEYTYSRSGKECGCVKVVRKYPNGKDFNMQKRTKSKARRECWLPHKFDLCSERVSLFLHMTKKTNL